MNNIIYVACLTLLLSSCASVFNGAHQNVELAHDRDTELLIDGKTPEERKGKYRLKRDHQPRQITLKKEGYKDEHVVIMQYKRSPLYALSVFPFGILVYPPVFDEGVKAYDYDKSIEINENFVALPEKPENAKSIELNTVAVDLEAEDIQFRFFSNYKDFIRTQDTKPTKSVGDEGDHLKLENTIFSDLLKELLHEKGYIDTTEATFGGGFSDDLFVNATIKSYTIHQMTTYKGLMNSGSYVSDMARGFVYSDVIIDWQALDYYKSPVYETEISTTSGQFVLTDLENNYEDVLKKSLSDAIEYGLIEFMNRDEVQRLLLEESQLAQEANYEKIMLPAADGYVSSLSEAVKSAVTIKTDKGHGSGFFVTADGYIVTNYHVVANQKDLQVIMNDESVYEEVEVVRFSKIYDLALLKVNANDVLPYQINTAEKVELASDVYAIGTPALEDLSQTISKGIVSGIRKTPANDSRLIQTDASINPGNSGGALVSKEGELIGVVSSKLRGYGVEGVAFGIPTSEIFRALKVEFEK
ncbi:MAG: S1C family serine protease [Bacteroidota bacterium]